MDFYIDNVYQTSVELASPFLAVFGIGTASCFIIDGVNDITKDGIKNKYKGLSELAIGFSGLVIGTGSIEGIIKKS